MEITQEVLDRFVKGQIKIKNEKEGYLFHGGVRSINLALGTIWIRHDWMARAENYPSHPLKEPIEWVAEERFNFSLNVSKFVKSDDNKLYFRPLTNKDNEVVTLILQGSGIEKGEIDPTTVKYLKVFSLDF